MALQLADSLIIFLLLATFLFALTYFYFTEREPAVAYVLATYTPFQNVVIPLIFSATTLPVVAGVALLSAKDLLLLVGLLFCLVRLPRLSLQLVDYLAFSFVGFLCVSLLLADSSTGDALRALRSFSIPVLL